jgi:hypothetical protein
LHGKPSKKEKIMWEIKREMHHRSLGREELRRAVWGYYPNSREETNERG